MSRKITQEAINAFMNGRQYRNSNTEVSVYETYGNYSVVLLLHGNRIARIARDTNQIEINTCGWNTTTTRERLNGIPGVHVQQKKGKLYLNGNEWDGEWVTI